MLVNVFLGVIIVMDQHRQTAFNNQKLNRFISLKIVISLAQAAFKLILLIIASNATVKIEVVTENHSMDSACARRAIRKILREIVS